MAKLVALDGIIYDGRIYMKGEEVEVADDDVELLEGNGHAGKPSSKDAKAAKKDDEGDEPSK